MKIIFLHNQKFLLPDKRYFFVHDEKFSYTIKIIILHNEKILHDEKWFFVRSEKNFCVRDENFSAFQRYINGLLRAYSGSEIQCFEKNVQNALCDCVELCL